MTFGRFNLKPNLSDEKSKVYLNCLRDSSRSDSCCLFCCCCEGRKEEVKSEQRLEFVGSILSVINE